MRKILSIVLGLALLALCAYSAVSLTAPRFKLAPFYTPRYTTYVYLYQPPTPFDHIPSVIKSNLPRFDSVQVKTTTELQDPAQYGLTFDYVEHRTEGATAWLGAFAIPLLFLAGFYFIFREKINALWRGG